MLRTSLKKTSSVLLAFAAIYILLFISLYFAASVRNNGYADQQIDAVVVFYGDFDKEGNLSDESLRRLSYAVSLYKENRNRNLIFAGGWRPEQKLLGSAMMAEKAVEMEVNPEKVFHDKVSRDTLQNWNEAEKIIKRKKLRKVLLVSSFFHMLRIKQIIKINDDIEAYYAIYVENTTLPPKGLIESFYEYNYNIISMTAYLILPSAK